ncbi:type IV conjugative transfer system protein TraL [Pseudomonas sp. 18175]|uniref:type IV conjugative transfer system protein TraL n=1 Tax=Pseudomonas sp. 18175 TaxID=3390056 RepID=UPI003D1DEE7A
MDDTTYIPRRLDDPWKLGFWDVDIAAPVLFGALIGYLSGNKWAFALCLAFGLLLARWIAHSKQDKHPAFALHWLYWHLPAMPLTALHATPPSYRRRLVG